MRLVRLLACAGVLSAVVAGCSGGHDAPPPPEAPAKLEPLAGIVPNGTPGSAGYVDGTGASARFRGVSDVAVGNDGTVYALDSGNRKVRKITPAGVVTTLASFGESPSTFLGGIAVDETGNVFVTRWDQCPPPDNLCVLRAEIDRIDPLGGIAPLPVRSSSDGTSTQLGQLDAIAVRSGFVYFVTRIAVRPSAGAVLRLAPDGDLTRLKIDPASAMALDDVANLYTVRFPIAEKLAPGGVSMTIGGPFTAPSGIAIDGAGNAYVSDSVDNVIRKITPSGMVTIIAGMIGTRGWISGNLPGALNGPGRMALHGRDLYIAMGDSVVVIRNVP